MQHCSSSGYGPPRTFPIISTARRPKTNGGATGPAKTVDTGSQRRPGSFQLPNPARWLISLKPLLCTCPCKAGCRLEGRTISVYDRRWRIRDGTAGDKYSKIDDLRRAPNLLSQPSPLRWMCFQQSGADGGLPAASVDSKYAIPAELSKLPMFTRCYW